MPAFVSVAFLYRVTGLREQAELQCGVKGVPPAVGRCLAGIQTIVFARLCRCVNSKPKTKAGLGASVCRTGGVPGDAVFAGVGRERIADGPGEAASRVVIVGELVTVFISLLKMVLLYVPT